MANGLTEYMQQLLDGAKSLHTRARQNTVHRKVKAFTARYTGLGTEAAGEYVRVAQFDAVHARIIPEALRIRFDGTGNFSMPARFFKITTQDGTPGHGQYAVSWTRSSTTATVTTPEPHGWSTGQILHIANSSDPAAVTNGTSGAVTVLSPVTFTMTCLNAGATAGTAVIGEVANSYLPVNFTRTTTTATVVTAKPHGYTTGDILRVTVTSSSAAIATGTYAITVSDAVTFTFTCLNAGDASGTLTMGPDIGNGVVLTTSVTLVQSAMWQGAGPATFTPPPQWRKSDELRLLWGTVGTVPPVTRNFTIEGLYTTLT